MLSTHRCHSFQLRSQLNKYFVALVSATFVTRQMGYSLQNIFTWKCHPNEQNLTNGGEFMERLWYFALINSWFMKVASFEAVLREALAEGETRGDKQQTISPQRETFEMSIEWRSCVSSAFEWTLQSVFCERDSPKISWEKHSILPVIPSKETSFSWGELAKFHKVN